MQTIALHMRRPPFKRRHHQRRRTASAWHGGRIVGRLAGDHPFRGLGVGNDVSFRAAAGSHSESGERGGRAHDLEERTARSLGIVLVRQRPGNGKAIFITLEDETGITNALLWARTFETFRAQVMGARLLLIEGRVQRSKEGVTHLMGVRVTDRSAELDRLSEDHVVHTELTRADEIKHPQHPRGPKGADGKFVHPRNVRVLPKSRDFH